MPPTTTNPARAVNIHGTPDIFWGVSEDSVSLDAALRGCGYVTKVSQNGSVPINEVVEDENGLAIGHITGGKDLSGTIDLVMVRSATLPQEHDVVEYNGAKGVITSVNLTWGNKEKGGASITVESKGATDYTQRRTITAA